MDNAIYAALTRQSGLMREMQIVANNIANASTTGFKREGVIFAEHLSSTDRGPDGLSMGHARGRQVDLSQAGMTLTGGTYDLALDGPGFFAVQTPNGPRLTRAGAFLTDAEGTLINPDGFQLLDEGQAPINIPPEAGKIAIGPDGTISADGMAIGRVGIFREPDPKTLIHEGGTLFATSDDYEPEENTRVQQGFLEGSNVEPITELSRMIEIQRAYELGQSFLDREDQRIRSAIKSMTS